MIFDVLLVAAGFTAGALLTFILMEGPGDPVETDPDDGWDEYAAAFNGDDDT